MGYHLDIVSILTGGFALASVLGYIMQQIRLPSILGYLIAGFLIGPYSPGFVADVGVTEQFADIGVILMLFGVGLHFSLKDLMSVKHIAIPGAIGQTIASSAVTAWLVYSLGWPLESGIILGLATGVASTVILIRVLQDNNLTSSLVGHISIGWLIVEDILTVVVLLLLPALAEVFRGNYPSVPEISALLGILLVKFTVLVLVMIVWGRKLAGFILNRVARTQSGELFTITVLALIFVIAVGSSVVFGTSIALGAFIAGMVVGQTDVRHQAAANSLPIKDIFAVFFFISVGMLFDYSAMIKHWPIFLGVLFIILVVKPLSAFLIVRLLRLSFKTATIVAVALAQIGEFSFILAKEAMEFDLIPDAGFDILVGCAAISLALNPILFKAACYLKENKERGKSGRAIKAKVLKNFPGTLSRLFERHEPGTMHAIVVGYGTVGQEVVRSLIDLNFTPVIIEKNIDIVTRLKNDNQNVIFGDASSEGILEAAHIVNAKILAITVSDVAKTTEIIKTANHMTKDVKILARIMQMSDLKFMKDVEAQYVCAETELSKGFAEDLRRFVTRRIRGTRRQGGMPS